MNKSLISVHDLSIGMKTEHDIKDNLYQPLLIKGTILNLQDIITLTNLKQTYFIYEDQLRETPKEIKDLISQINVFLRTNTNMEHWGVNLDTELDCYTPRQKQINNPNWEQVISYDYFKHLFFKTYQRIVRSNGNNEQSVSLTLLNRACEYVVSEMNKSYWQGSFDRLFYHKTCQSWLKVHTNALTGIFDKMMLPKSGASIINIHSKRVKERRYL
ncbi:hypothetical protein [Salipaludibacillus sp. CF4.18]|uniref:hypothetical protein n=1 Tax=Salipaludibacillus sp. CF4.18 TaxID=3373081 RepID=UPI003EE77170